MQNREISIQIQRLQSLVKRANEATGENIELLGDWAKYLCVLAAGLLENSLKEIYSDFANRTTSKPIAMFVSSSLSPIRNPKAQKFLDTARAFSAPWGDELENYLDDNGRREAIDTIIGQRHLIAHGRYRDSTISMVQIQDYLGKAVEVMDFIDTQCLR